jgi:hypothetical protein
LALIGQLPILDLKAFEKHAFQKEAKLTSRSPLCHTDRPVLSRLHVPIYPILKSDDEFPLIASHWLHVEAPTIKEHHVL